MELDGAEGREIGISPGRLGVAPLDNPLSLSLVSIGLKLGLNHNVKGRKQLLLGSLATRMTKATVNNMPLRTIFASIVLTLAQLCELEPKCPLVSSHMNPRIFTC